MSQLDEFALRVRQRLEAQRGEQAAAQEAVEQAMRSRRDAGARIWAIAEPIQRGTVVPLMETLARQLGASVEHLDLPGGRAAVVHRPRTDAFPARARLSVGVAWSEETGRLWLSADQTFMPVLLSLDRTTQLPVDVAAPDGRAIGAWVEERILAFVDACLEVERSDVYQQSKHHTDPVCGMTIAETPETLVLEREGRRHYFCSATCRDRFVTAAARYAGNPRGRQDPADGGPP